MAESGESRVTGSLDIGIKYDGYSKDLLTSFSSNLCSNTTFDYGQEEEVELTLGLSLNGRFGVNPNAPKLARSSSIPEYMNPSAPPDKVAAAAARQVCGSLARTSSLPVEPEAEVRKRKEMQSLRRMEAKRKRAEKQRHMMSTRAAKERECSRGQGSVAPAPATIPRMRVKGLGVSEKLMIRSTRSTAVSQSQGSCSESESQVVEGTGKSGGEAKSLLLASVEQIVLEQNKEEAGAGLARCSSLGTSGMKSQFNKLTVSDNGSATPESAARHVMMMPDMPCVSTQGGGPEGKRVEGFLYRYSKSEEVRIVCVCHGLFLSPAEFVKHAGGTDVEQPLKHITVTPSATFL